MNCRSNEIMSKKEIHLDEHEDGNSGNMHTLPVKAGMIKGAWWLIRV